MQHIVILAPPRSGAGLVQTLLAAVQGCAASGLSVAGTIDAATSMQCSDRHFVSNRMHAQDVSEEWIEAVTRAVHATSPSTATTVDWDPLWSVRVGALARALPDARFLVVNRRAESAVASMAEAWRSHRFVTEPNLPGWWGEQWSFPLVTDWAQLRGLPMQSVCAGQWSGIVDAMVEDLAHLDPSRWTVVGFEEVLESPSLALTAACARIGITLHGKVADEMPLSAGVVSAPARGKWHGSAAEVLVGVQRIQPSIVALQDLVASRRPEYAWPEPEAAPTAPTPTRVDSAATPFKTEYTNSVAELLRQLGQTLAISTYKSGHVILARYDDGGVNVEFHSMPRPMGIAVGASKLAIGTTETIDYYSANTAIAPKVPSPRVVDVAYVPRSVAFTGDVSIHDMDFDAEGHLHFVNTRFSCLCVPHGDYSFEPTWRPEWITGLAAEDRCHLNGLAMVDGAPRYVTALSRTDTAAGWRALKGTSGLIVDITDNRVVTEGLAMPHSPRWHDGKLWVLESGKGTLATVDVETGEVTTVATLPGFTRGLSFVGQYALIGLSQVRESVFSSLPVTEQAAERNCGVWIVDTTTSVIVGWLKFDGVVQEIFDVRLLPAAWPTIVGRGDLSRSSFVLSPATLAQMAMPSPAE